MLISKNIGAIDTDWALKRLRREPIIKTDSLIKQKLLSTRRTILKYKAIIAITFLIVSQFAIYDFNIDEYTTTNYYGANANKSVKNKN